MTKNSHKNCTKWAKNQEKANNDEKLKQMEKADQK